MNNFKKQILALAVGLLLLGGCLQAMEAEKNLIEFKGEKKLLSDWIAETLQSKEPEEHPFSVTAIVRFNNNKFVLQGDILSINNQDRKDIDNDNYVYCPMYSTQKTRVNPATYESVGAIIVGTKNKDACYNLALGEQHRILEPVKQKMAATKAEPRRPNRTTMQKKSIDRMSNMDSNNPIVKLLVTIKSLRSQLVQGSFSSNPFMVAPLDGWFLKKNYSARY